MRENPNRYQTSPRQGRASGYQPSYDTRHTSNRNINRGARNYNQNINYGTSGQSEGYQRQIRHTNMIPTRQEQSQPRVQPRYQNQTGVHSQERTQYRNTNEPVHTPVNRVTNTHEKKNKPPVKESKPKKIKGKKIKVPKGKLNIPSGKKVKRTIEVANKKLVAAGAAVVLALGGGSIAFLNRDQSKTMVCESAVDYNKGIGYTFYVGRNGKDIDTIEKNDTVSLKFIKKNLGEENAQQILEEYKKKTEESYKATVAKYSKYSFFDSDIKTTKDKVAVNYRIRVADDSFSYKKYKDVLDEFGMSYFYNAQKDAFIYDEDSFLSEDIPLGSIEDVACHVSKKKLKVKTATNAGDSENSSKKKSGDK